MSSALSLPEVNSESHRNTVTHANASSGCYAAGFPKWQQNLIPCCCSRVDIIRPKTQFENKNSINLHESTKTRSQKSWHLPTESRCDNTIFTECSEHITDNFSCATACCVVYFLLSVTSLNCFWSTLVFFQILKFLLQHLHLL